MPPLERIITIPSVKSRSPDGHKGTYGNALIVAGSRGMSGAAALAGRSALRGGAGLVTVAVPVGIQSVVAGLEPAYMTVGLPETSAGRLSLLSARIVCHRAKSASAIAFGSGCGASSGVGALARELYSNATAPLVLDADGLNVLADDFVAGLLTPAGPRVLTPHPGEFARLIGSDARSVQANREALAVEFAIRHNVVLLLKGRQTLICDGRRLAINATGNPGMATGGTGDVLTGLIAALLAQGWPAFEAAQLGAHLHGLAGDLAVARFKYTAAGPADSGVRPGLIATDLPEYFAEAWSLVGG